MTAVAGMSQADLRDFFIDHGVTYRSTATPLQVLIGGLIGTASHVSRQLMILCVQLLNVTGQASVLAIPQRP